MEFGMHEQREHSSERCREKREKIENAEELAPLPATLAVSAAS
jgi:hypothetical protein